MRWDRKIGRILKVFFGSVVISTIVITAFAFFIGGPAALINGIYWGVAFGLLGGALATASVVTSLYWSDFFGEIGDAVNDPNIDPGFQLGKKNERIEDVR